MEEKEAVAVRGNAENQKNEEKEEEEEEEEEKLVTRRGTILKLRVTTSLSILVVR